MRWVNEISAINERMNSEHSNETRIRIRASLVTADARRKRGCAQAAQLSRLRREHGAPFCAGPAAIVRETLDRSPWQQGAQARRHCRSLHAGSLAQLPVPSLRVQSAPAEPRSVSMTQFCSSGSSSRQPQHAQRLQPPLFERGTSVTAANRNLRRPPGGCRPAVCCGHQRPQHR